MHEKKELEKLANKGKDSAIYGRFQDWGKFWSWPSTEFMAETLLNETLSEPETWIADGGEDVTLAEYEGAGTDGLPAELLKHGGKER